jgi:PAT family beta-lactamase induction signal transducer AmpG
VQPVVRFARDLGWGALLLMVFAVIFRLPDQLAGRMTMPLLIQELNFTAADVGAVRQFLGMIITIAGAVIGGVAVAKFGLGRALLLFGALQAVSNGGFWILSQNDPSYPLMVAVILTEGFCSGLVSAGFIAFLMSCCDRRYSATQYAILTGLMGLAGAVAPAWSGYLVTEYGYASFFLLTIAAGVPGVLMIPFIRRTSKGELAPTCIGCGYSLRGLRNDRCPECGMPFARPNALALDLS